MSASDPPQPEPAPQSAAAVARINTLLSTGEAGQALSVADAALATWPDNRLLWFKRGTVLRALLRFDEALAHFQAMLERFPDEIDIRHQLAVTCRGTGDLAAAADHDRAVLAKNPDHPAALAGLATTLTARGDHAAAVELTERALRAHPKNRALLLRRGASLRALGRSEAAAAVLRDALESFPGDIALQIELAAALSASSRFDAALALYRGILEQDPRHPGALAGQVNALLSRAQPTEAMEAVTRALAALPDNRTLLKKRGVVLRAMAYPGAAIAHFEDMLTRWPGDIDLRHELALTHRSASDFEAALAIYDDILAEAPDHTAARHGRIDALLGLGDYARAQDLLADQAGGGTLQRLKALEVGMRLQNPPDPGPDLEHVALHLDDLDERQLWRLFSICEKLDRADVAQRVFPALLRRPAIPYDVALHIVRRLHADREDAALDGAVALLRSRIGARRDEFDLETTFIRQGPIEAVRVARRQKRRARGQTAALQLARLLTDAGEARLAMRYLWHCSRKWPLAYPIVAATVHSCIEAGAPETALRYLQTIRSGTADFQGEIAYLHARVLLELGALDKAGAALRGAEGRLTRERTLKQRISLEISFGNPQSARALFAELTGLPGSSVKLARHGSISMTGTQINELELYYAERRSRGVDRNAPPDDPDEVLRYLHPATRVIAGFMATPHRVAGLRSDVPRQVVQYWDREPVPRDIAFLTGLWQKKGGIDNLLFDRARALAFLQTELGPQWVAAFRLARHAAEQSDFFRLCYLLVRGGIYVDADDRVLRDVWPLIETSGGLLAFAEPYGTIENNFIAVRPGHPAIRVAAFAARAALLQKASETTWAKTGPGLLTRAIAHYLLRTPPREAAREVTILPRYRLRSYIQIHIPLAYKTTATYWNAASRANSAAFQEMIEAALNRAGPD